MKSEKQKGVAAVEMALVLIPMLILCLGITELGRALYQYNGLVRAVRGAVRYLAQQDLANLSAGELSSVRSKAINLAVCGEQDCTGKQPLVVGLSAAQVSLCDYLDDLNYYKGPPCSSTYKNTATGQGTVDLVSVTIGGVQAFNFTSVASWVIPDMAFSPIQATMASRFF